jgi:hypothetical protein
MFISERSLPVCSTVKGAPVRRATFDCTRTAIAQLAKEQLGHSDMVALEATTNSWSVAEILEPHVARVVVSNPLKTKAIAASAAQEHHMSIIHSLQTLAI